MRSKFIGAICSPQILRLPMSSADDSEELFDIYTTAGGVSVDVNERKHKEHREDLLKGRLPTLTRLSQLGSAPRSTSQSI